MRPTGVLLRFSLGQLLAGRRLLIVPLVALPLVLVAVFAAGLLYAGHRTFVRVSYRFVEEL